MRSSGKKPTTTFKAAAAITLNNLKVLEQQHHSTSHITFLLIDHTFNADQKRYLEYHLSYFVEGLGRKKCKDISRQRQVFQGGLRVSRY